MRLWLADNLDTMLFRRKRSTSGVKGGFLHFHDSSNRVVAGPGDGDYIHLRDEFGNEWRGVAERQPDDTIRYRFRSSNGDYITGISDGYGVILRDQKGNTWRGFID